MKSFSFTIALLLWILPLAAIAKAGDANPSADFRSESQRVPNVNGDPIYDLTTRTAEQGNIGVQGPVAIARDRRAGSGQQTGGPIASSNPKPFNEAGKVCSRNSALSSLREIMKWGSEVYDLEQCSNAMQRNILLFCFGFFLLLVSYQLSSAAETYPTGQKDESHADFTRAQGKLTAFPVLTAIVAFICLSVMTNRLLEYRSTRNDLDRAFAEFNYYIPIGDNFFLLLLLGAFTLSATALFKISMAQSRLGATTSGSMKLIAILPPTLSTCASGMTIVKTFLI